MPAGCDAAKVNRLGHNCVWLTVRCLPNVGISRPFARVANVRGTNCHGGFSYHRAGYPSARCDEVPSVSAGDARSQRIP